MENKGKLTLPPLVLATLVLFFVILLLALPRARKFNYDYKKGSPWPYETLVAQFDFPILKTDDQLRQERAGLGSNMVPYYKYSEATTRSATASAEKLNFGGLTAMKPRIVSSLGDILARGVMADADAADAASNRSISSQIIYVQKEKRAVKVPAAEVFTVSGAKSRLLSESAKDYEGYNLDSLFTVLKVYDLIVPNLIYDKETTELIHDETSGYVSTTQGFANAGQLIVSKSEIITADVMQMLDSYKAEYENNLGYGGNRLWLWLGNGLLALALTLILYLSVFYTNSAIFTESNRFVYLVFIVAVAAVSALVVDEADPDLLYLIPFSLVVLYLLAFFKKRVVLPMYVIALLPMMIFAHNGIELFVMNLLAGVVTMHVFHFYRGWRQFVMALIAFCCCLAVYIAFRLINGTHIFSNLYLVFYLFLGSFMAVAGYPLIYLFEKAFGLLSQSRLMELCDTNNNQLLVELAQKAPGTFQHSLQVMNMADATARAIGANNLLVKAGALYHDIGKINNPQCFIENENFGSHYHEGLTPLESAKAIIRHVPDGLALADKYRLPAQVRDFIITHHGTTCTEYFYTKYINAGGDPDNAQDFYYPGSRPTTKEQVILMLCDTLEAASRTVKNNSPEAYDLFVESIVAGKMGAGQFEEADISLRELGEVKTFLKSYLRQIYHERVVYPNRKKDKGI